MLRRTTLLSILAAIATSSGALMPSEATAQSEDPFAGHIVRVVYRWDNNSSWGFMVHTDKSGQRCFRFGDPGFRPKTSDIMGVDHAQPARRRAKDKIRRGPGYRAAVDRDRGQGRSDRRSGAGAGGVNTLVPRTQRSA